MIVLFNDFLAEVIPDVHGCPDIVAINAVRNAAIELCKRTNYWKVDLDAFSTEVNTLVYDLDSPENGAAVSMILSLFRDGVEIEPRTEEWLNENVATWRTSTGVPAYYFRPSSNTVMLARLPGAAYSITGSVSLVPKRTATGINSVVYEAHLETIAAGAKARLMVMPNVPWSNPPLAQFHGAKFNDGITNANVDAAKGLSRAPLRTKSCW